MTHEPDAPAVVDSPIAKQPKKAVNLSAVVFAGVYLLVVVLVGQFARPLDRLWLAGVAVIPGLVTFLCGIPRVIRVRPRRIPILFHLIVYPIAAIITMGLPAVFFAALVGGLFD